MTWTGVFQVLTFIAGLAVIMVSVSLFYDYLDRRFKNEKV